MKTKQARILDTFQRVQRFLDDNAPALGDINSSGTRKDLDRLITALNQHAVAQEVNRRLASAETVRTRVLTNALLINHMRPIARIASAELTDVPGFAALGMPTHHETPRRLIAAAGAMAEAAGGFTETFISAGLPADFIERMTAAAARLDDSLGQRGSMVGSRTGATSGMEADITKARKSVKTLSALVEPMVQDNEALLAAWRSARKYLGQKKNSIIYAAPALVIRTPPAEVMIAS